MARVKISLGNLTLSMTKFFCFINLTKIKLGKINLGNKILINLHYVFLKMIEKICKNRNMPRSTIRSDSHSHQSGRQIQVHIEQKQLRRRAEIIARDGNESWKCGTTAYLLSKMRRFCVLE